MSQVASTYARAIFEAAGADVETVASELEQLAAVERDEPATWATLTDPKVGETDRMHVLNKLFADGHKLTRNTLAVLVRMGRLEDLDHIVAALHALVRGSHGQLDVNLTTAVELPAELRSTIEQRLSKSTGNKVRLHESVDPEIIGGLIVRHGDTLIDASVRSRIQTLKTRLSRPAQHG